jgi:hypothetical protein
MFQKWQGLTLSEAERRKCPDLAANTRFNTRVNTHAAMAKKCLLKSEISG